MYLANRKKHFLVISNRANRWRGEWLSMDVNHSKRVFKWNTEQLLAAKLMWLYSCTCTEDHLELWSADFSLSLSPYLHHRKRYLKLDSWMRQGKVSSSPQNIYEHKLHQLLWGCKNYKRDSFHFINDTFISLFICVVSRVQFVIIIERRQTSHIHSISSQITSKTTTTKRKMVQSESTATRSSETWMKFEKYFEHMFDAARQHPINGGWSNCSPNP